MMFNCKRRGDPYEPAQCSYDTIPSRLCNHGTAKCYNADASTYTLIHMSYVILGAL